MVIICCCSFFFSFCCYHGICYIIIQFFFLELVFCIRFVCCIHLDSHLSKEDDNNSKQKSKRKKMYLLSFLSVSNSCWWKKCQKTFPSHSMFSLLANGSIAHKNEFHIVFYPFLFFFIYLLENYFSLMRVWNSSFLTGKQNETDDFLCFLSANVMKFKIKFPI